MARRATFIKQVRSGSEYSLVLDAGNALAGVAGLNASTHGAVAIAAMNLMGYDAMALGERDLSLGASALSERMAESDFPFLSANVVIAETGELFAEPYIVLDLGAHRVGIVGLTEQLDSLPKQDADSVTLAAKDPLEFGLPYIEQVIGQADVVVVLSHMGQVMDEMLATQIPGIDIIIEGRDGMIMTPVRYNSTGPVMAQVGAQGQLAGVLRVDFDEGGNITGFEGRPQLLTSDYADDPQMLELLSSFQR